ncbi:hypothetical protein [Abyssalbus ytuae]|uniref:Uncharacterized protein n=1 Tax=Abyssalbus ytuae TaxID=2926907 RepID=A0A9E7D4V6_9FLAO|nr:hypothetical protein [Abyssalbus ytuae]UOB19359.1 hypothetical protein MQE35_08680 [Abyssalbus ytuae]
MTSKNYLDQFIQKLESKTNIKFDWIDRNISKGKFTFENTQLEKTITGTLELQSDRIQAKLFYNKNYSLKYIKSELRNILEHMGSARTFLTFANHFPIPDDYITTKFLIDELSEGDEIEIPYGTYYYSVNNDYLDCNGWPLEEKFVGQFVEQVMRGCESGTLEPLPHTVFKLIKKY